MTEIYPLRAPEVPKLITGIGRALLQKHEAKQLIRRMQEQVGVDLWLESLRDNVT